MKRKSKDTISAALMKAAAIFASSLVFIIATVLLLKAWPILSQKTIVHLLFSSSWFPLKGNFGFFPFIIGTIEVTAIAMLIAVPICMLSAIYLSEYAHTRLREIARPFIDLLAGIPSVIYGFWGVIVIVPAVRWVGRLLGYETTGYSLLSGGIILAIMVFPIIISVSLEVFRAVPFELKEAALALGLTKWEMVKHVMIRGAVGGIFASIMLGFSRAFGETIAVLMVVGNVVKVPSSVFDAAYPLPALIANNYGEMMSIPMYDSALMLSALMLLVIVAAFNLGAYLILLNIKRRREK